MQLFFWAVSCLAALGLAGAMLAWAAGYFLERQVEREETADFPPHFGPASADRESREGREGPRAGAGSGAPRYFI